jgi:hypothetical protein
LLVPILLLRVRWVKLPFLCAGKPGEARASVLGRNS